MTTPNSPKPRDTMLPVEQDKAIAFAIELLQSNFKNYQWALAKMQEQHDQQLADQQQVIQQLVKEVRTGPCLCASHYRCSHCRALSIAKPHLKETK